MWFVEIGHVILRTRNGQQVQAVTLLIIVHGQTLNTTTQELIVIVGSSKLLEGCSECRRFHNRLTHFANIISSFSLTSCFNFHSTLKTYFSSQILSTRRCCYLYITLIGFIAFFVNVNVMFQPLRACVRYSLLVTLRVSYPSYGWQFFSGKKLERVFDLSTTQITTFL